MEIVISITECRQMPFFFFNMVVTRTGKTGMYWKKYVYLIILEHLKFLFFSSTVLECTVIFFSYPRILANFGFKNALHIP